MKPTRSETLSLLSSLGVEIPPDSKLQDAALASKLKKALNLAQRLSEVMPHGTLDPAAAPPWTASKKLLQDIMGTHSIEEHLQAAENKRGQADVPDPLAQPFVGMRQSLRGVGKAWDESKYRGPTPFVSFALDEMLQLALFTLSILFRPDKVQ
jgi:hypothetical protein